MMVWVDYHVKLPIVLPEYPTVYDLKIEIEETFEIPRQNQQLYYFNTLLSDPLYLVIDYGIQPGDELVLYAMRSFTIAYEFSTYTVDISDGKSVSDLAEVAGQEIGVRGADVILWWGEEELDEDKTIREYQIPVKGATIRVLSKIGIIIEAKKCEYFVRVCELTSVAKLKQKLEDTFGLNKNKIQLISPTNSTGYLSDNVTMLVCGINGHDKDKLLLVED